MSGESSKELLVLISAFAPGDEGAIHAYKLETATGRLELINKATEVENPFFLALHPGLEFVYSVHEVGSFGGNDSGGVAALSLDRSTGAMSVLNSQESGGKAACYLDVDSKGKCLVVANYSGGSVAALPIREDGTLGEATSFIQHEGSSVDASRQKGPHAHCFVVGPDDRYAYCADLGLDKVMIYRLDAEQGKLTPGEQPFARTVPGAGPRHFTFHPNGEYAYAINEMGNSATTFRHETCCGMLIELQTLSTLPEGYEETTHCADVKITPSGKFLYGTNRGHDSVAIYAIDEQTGMLSLVDIQDSQGENPQNLAITPDGSLLLVANMGGGNVVTFAIDGQTGKLSQVEEELQMPSPSCIMVAPLGG